MDKRKMYDQIERHGRDLLAIYPQASELDPVKLCKRLRRLEVQGNRLATDYCNGTNNINSGNWESLSGKIVARAQAVLGPGPAIFANGDARGYFLKINSKQSRQLEIHKDWGGYGIIAPDFREG